MLPPLTSGCITVSGTGESQLEVKGFAVKKQPWEDANICSVFVEKKTEEKAAQPPEVSLCAVSAMSWARLENCLLEGC